MNLNDYVKVVLTASGADTLNKQENRLYGGVPIHTYTEGDEYRIQLWMLIETFGRSISETLKSPFKDNEIVPD